jgi:hypothetical protein
MAKKNFCKPYFLCHPSGRVINCRHFNESDNLVQLECTHSRKLWDEHGVDVFACTNHTAILDARRGRD